MGMSVEFQSGSHLRRLVNGLLDHWPDHRAYVEKRFANVDDGAARHNELLADLILRLCSDDLPRIVEDYRWMGDEFLREELYFRRTGEYRRKTLEETIREVYSDDKYMSRYMNGLLLSQLLWSNHAGTARYVHEIFLKQNPDGYTHLEIGPGHGLLLAFAARDPRCASVTGWDISAASLEATRECLIKLGVDADNVRLAEQNIIDLPDKAMQYDSIVISHVLEHLEEPGHALQGLKSLLTARGRAFVVVPTNSPTPDHIYLFRHPDEVRDLIETNGLHISELRCYPATGYSLDRAQRKNLPISVAVVIRKNPANDRN